MGKKLLILSKTVALTLAAAMAIGQTNPVMAAGFEGTGSNQAVSETDYADNEPYGDHIEELEVDEGTTNRVTVWNSDPQTRYQGSLSDMVDRFTEPEQLDNNREWLDNYFKTLSNLAMFDSAYGGYYDTNAVFKKQQVLTPKDIAIILQKYEDCDADDIGAEIYDTTTRMISTTTIKQGTGYRFESDPEDYPMDTLVLKKPGEDGYWEEWQEWINEHWNSTPEREMLGDMPYPYPTVKRRWVPGTEPMYEWEPVWFHKPGDTMWDVTPATVETHWTRVDDPVFRRLVEYLERKEGSVATWIDVGEDEPVWVPGSQYFDYVLKRIKNICTESNTGVVVNTVTHVVLEEEEVGWEKILSYVKGSNYFITKLKTDDGWETVNMQRTQNDDGSCTLVFNEPGDYIIEEHLTGNVTEGNKKKYKIYEYSYVQDLNLLLYNTVTEKTVTDKHLEYQTDVKYKTYSVTVTEETINTPWLLKDGKITAGTYTYLIE